MSGLSTPFPSAVIFDWDNTLVDTWDAIAEALNKVRAMAGLETWTVEEARIKSAYPLRVSFPRWFGDEWEKMRDIFYDHFRKIQMERLQRKEGAEELLLWLQTQKIPLFVVSTKRQDLLLAEAEHLGWRTFFTEMIGVRDGSPSKPNRQPVDIALSKADLCADNPSVWFVGDTHVDVECALSSGCTPIFVWNLHQGQKLGIKNNFSDCVAIKTALSKWNKNSS
ncbi:MAG: HAD family hydrolase [Bdellovibrionales bacterium]